MVKALLVYLQVISKSQFDACQVLDHSSLIHSTPLPSTNLTDVKIS